jgi:hypothetical protein
VLEYRVALGPVGTGQVGRDRALDQVQAAAVHQQPPAGLPLELAPQPPGLERELGVARVPVVIADRTGQAERGRRRVADPGPVEYGDGFGQRRGLVRGHEPHHAAADDRQPSGQYPRSLGFPTSEGFRTSEVTPAGHLADLRVDRLSRCYDLSSVCEYVRTRRKLGENLQAGALHKFYNGPVSVVNSAVVSM